MFHGPSPETPERIGFLLVPQFSMVAFFGAVEPLRIANRLSGRALYSWHIFSADGEPVPASNGMTVIAEAAIASVARFPAVIVCASFDPQDHETKPLLSWLRRLRERVPNSLWLNPEPERIWDAPTIRVIRTVFPMFPLTLDGLGDAVDVLRGAKANKVSN